MRVDGSQIEYPFQCHVQVKKIKYTKKANYFCYNDMLLVESPDERSENFMKQPVEKYRKIICCNLCVYSLPLSTLPCFNKIVKPILVKHILCQVNLSNTFEIHTFPIWNA